MKKLFLVILSTLFVLLEASNLKHAQSYKQAIDQGVKEKKNVILFVYSSYCPWCKKMEKTTLQDPEVIKYVNDNYIFVAVNQDVDAFPEKFLPYGVPTTYVIDPTIEEKMFTMKGYKSSKSFLNRIRQ
ncbi:MAG: thioredoxin family protein [Campylobacterales bacterium]|nr:thioredoxin family protein [Campylobacterales bacterium]